MVKKQLYETPEAELLIVRFEKNIMSFDTDNNTETLIFDDDEDL